MGPEADFMVDTNTQVVVSFLSFDCLARQQDGLLFYTGIEIAQHRENVYTFTSIGGKADD